MQHINLEQFAGGAFTAQINRELKKVAENSATSQSWHKFPGKDI